MSHGGMSTKRLTLAELDVGHYLAGGDIAVVAVGLPIDPEDYAEVDVIVRGATAAKTNEAIARAAGAADIRCLSVMGSTFRLSYPADATVEVWTG